MRSRNIKPGFFKNETLADLAPDIRLLYVGLWCLADREGRLEDRPKRIKAELFPYENKNVESMLSKLAQAGFIIRYTVDTSDYMVIPRFKLHQNPHKNEAQSVIPACDDFATLREDSGASTVRLGLIPDSLLLIPDILIPDMTGSLQERESAFERFWKLYPNKKSKGQAETTWGKVTKTVPPEEIITGLARRAEAIKDMGDFMPYPSTWLNDKGWLDEDDYSAEATELEIVLEQNRNPKRVR